MQSQAARVVVVMLCLVAKTSAQPPTPVDFNADVQPILARACFSCHGPDDKTRQADLRLDTREGALRSDNPAIVPGNLEATELVRRITSRDRDLQMPPADSKQQLSANDIEVLCRWIKEGAVWGDHWSFQPLKHAPPAKVIDRTWSRGVSDDFVLSRLEQMMLRPSAEAVKETQLRRVTLDLVGLPPTLDEQTEFMSDNRPDAYERSVDRLFASPHFGERWGRHWLDVARYADSSGFEGDPPRTVWKYRDWVINSINADMPFDEFTIRQLAGDLLTNVSIDDRIATGFLLNSQQDGGTEPARLDAVVDRVNTIGTVYLGLTLGCAQCHSHKFDPVSQREYYALFAFVNSADEVKLEFAAPDQMVRRDALVAQVTSLTAERTAYGATLPADKLKNDPGYLERTATIESLSNRIPNFDSALVLQVATPPRVTTTFVRGEYSYPGEPVASDVPHVLPSMPEGVHNRLDLARWLVSVNQPLTPRVTVNRVWQQLFGRGLVATEADFGTQGARPTHPELLDWLASEFSNGSWSSKGLIRRIVGSATYRQSSYRRPDLEPVDPGNRWLARQTRLRLEAEAVRDVALSAAGLLSTKVGGPSVYPFQHEGILINRATPATWTISPGEDRYRRGLYTYYWRLTPHPQLQTFDAPDSITACTKRQSSNTPLQALTLLNDPTFIEAAETLAQAFASDRSANDDERMNRAAQHCLSRPFNEEERQQLLDLLYSVKSRPIANAKDSVESQNAVELAAWKQLTRTIFNLEEFIVRE